MKKSLGLISVAVVASALVLSSSVMASTLESGEAEVTIIGGSLGIHSFPAVLEFEDYTIGNAHAQQNLKNPFVISLEDFTGTYAGWNLTMTVNSLTSGTDNLNTPSLNSTFAAMTVNDSDQTGTQAGADTSALGTFTATSGPIAFGSGKKILSASADNADATSRHYFNFPVDSLELSFLNSTKAGTYTGVTTFALVATP